VVAADHPVSERSFSKWSMAFASTTRPEEMPLARAAIQDVFAASAGAGEMMFSALQKLIVTDQHRFFL
jgi:hypothetical protein